MTLFLDNRQRNEMKMKWNNNNNDDENKEMKVKRERERKYEGKKETIKMIYKQRNETKLLHVREKIANI